MTQSLVHSVGVTTQQHARLQLLEELAGADVDAVQYAQPVAKILLHGAQELVLGLAMAQVGVVDLPNAGPAVRAASAVRIRRAVAEAAGGVDRRFYRGRRPSAFDADALRRIVHL